MGILLGFRQWARAAAAPSAIIVVNVAIE